MMRTSQYFVAAAFALPLFAQEPVPEPSPKPEPAQQTAAVSPMLVVKTNRDDVAMMAAMSFDYVDELPDVSDGGHYVLSLGTDKKLTVTSGTGDVGTLQVVAEPGLLMEAFAEDIEGGRAMMRGALTMGFQEGGMSPKDAAALVKDILEFPRQLQRITLRLDGDPDMFPEDPLDVTLDIDPKAGSPFAALVGKLTPSSQGVPTLAAAGAIMTMQLSLDPKGLDAAFAPFKRLTAGVLASGEEHQKAWNEIFDKSLALYDGGMAWVFGEGMAMQALVGVRDLGQVRELMTSEAYLEAMKNPKLSNRDMEVEIDVDALEHREIKLTRSKVTGGPANPMAPDGTMESFVGAAGSYLVMSMGGGPAKATQLIDAILDQKVKRTPLAGGVLAQMTMDVAGLMAVAAPQMGGLPPDAPSGVAVSVLQREGGLRVKVGIE
jgi:hypothetical protein